MFEAPASQIHFGGYFTVIVFKLNLLSFAFEKTPSISLSCKLVPFQYREYEVLAAGDPLWVDATQLQFFPQKVSFDSRTQALRKSGMLLVEEGWGAGGGGGGGGVVGLFAADAY